MTTFKDAAYVTGYCKEQLKIPAKDIPGVIDEAKARIVAAADYDLTDELAQTLIRLDELYERAVKMQDIKTANAVLAGRVKLLGLGGKSSGPVLTVDYHDAENDMILDAVRSNLEALNIAPAGLPLEDLTRKVVLEFMKMQKCLLQGTKGHAPALTDESAPK